MFLLSIIHYGSCIASVFTMVRDWICGFFGLLLRDILLDSIILGILIIMILLVGEKIAGIKLFLERSMSFLHEKARNHVKTITAWVISLMSIVLVILVTVLSGKLLFDLILPASIVLATFLFNRALKQAEHNLTLSLKQIEHEREDRQVSTDALKDLVSKLAEFRGNELYKTDETLQAQIEMIISSTLSICTADDRLRIMILLIKSRFIENEETIISLSGMDISRADFRSYNGRLSNLNLQGLKMKNVNFTRKNLSGSDLSGANLREAILVGVSLHGANFAEADLTDAKYDLQVLRHAVSLRYTILSDGYVNQGDTLDER